MQRMLSLYPKGFSLPPVYTTRAGASGGQLQVVDEAFVESLKEKGLLAFEETAVGERYVVSCEDIAECAPFWIVMLIECRSQVCVQLLSNACIYMSMHCHTAQSGGWPPGHLC